MAKYFKFKELVRSNTADKNGINNLPKDIETIDNIIYTMDRLDEIREGYGSPIIVTSGFRCKALNDKVGGVKDSYHQTGMATDFKWDSALFEYLIYHPNFDKLIKETDKKTVWIHVQFKRNREEERNAVIYISK